MPRLLVIDDRDQTIEMCHRNLGEFDYVTRCDRQIPCQVCEERDRGCSLKCAHDYFEAAEILKRLPSLPDLVVLDLDFSIPEERLLPENKDELPTDEKKRKTALQPLRRKQGLLILERLRQDYPLLPVVLLTTTDTELPQSRDPGVYLCENELIDSRTLASEITRALDLHHKDREGPVFWGQSAAMKGVRRSLEVLARSPLPVLLQGETGTGKSYLAETVLHPRSGLKGPFVVTDLSTIPTALLPAHLFGTRRGAYTGSTQDQAGVFEQAHGGTLFLDEIGNLDLDLQRQLLVVLERGEVQRIGDGKARQASVKLVAATNRDLAELVQEGRFRADLYMRLNPATRLSIPPLRERKEDLPDLLRFAFLQALASEALEPLCRQYLARFPTPRDFDARQNTVIFGPPRAEQAVPDGFTVFLRKSAVEKLCQHSWPGNTRELRALATNAIVACLAQALESSHTVPGRAPAIVAIADPLVDRLLAQPGLARPEATRPGAVARQRAGETQVQISITPRETLAQLSVDVEKQYLHALFQLTEGDLDAMARIVLGPKGNGRQIHLRLNQLGLGVKKLREQL